MANLLGAYGTWAAGLAGDGPGRLSLRSGTWSDLDAWRVTARDRVMDLLAGPQVDRTPAVDVRARRVVDRVEIEELAWQLPWGPVTAAVLLKPAGANGRLPAVLALHDHGGLKYFGKEKVADAGAGTHPTMRAYREEAYGGVAWANALARQGYVVLAPDVFPFGSRRVRIMDVPDDVRPVSLPEGETDDPAAVMEYDMWAAEYEPVIAKSLLCAGTTWPGVWLAEDRVALDVLCARADVDPGRIGCAGLSLGGLRTCYLAGLDDRIACAVCVGMMTTWRDYLLHKSYTHTWMIYIPHLPRDLDYPEVLGLRAPQPTLVLNNTEDPLFTLGEMRRADEMLGAVYGQAGAAEAYRCSFYPGEHKFDREMQGEAFGWLGRWLGQGHVDGGLPQP